jgi:hypothetical protein
LRQQNEAKRFILRDLWTKYQVVPPRFAGGKTRLKPAGWGLEAAG